MRVHRGSLGVADWPGQSFDLPAGFSLGSGQAVRARQQRGADASDWSRDAATVQSVPSSLGPWIGADRPSNGIWTQKG
jgi:hypothetical protein